MGGCLTQVRDFRIDLNEEAAAPGSRERSGGGGRRPVGWGFDPTGDWRKTESVRISVTSLNRVTVKSSQG